jgi:hypothetical protein
VGKTASLRSRFCNPLTLLNRARQRAVRIYFHYGLLVFFKAAPHIQPELTKYIPPDIIGHGDAEAVDPISCAPSTGWLPNPRNERCAQRASKSRVREVLTPAVVSRHKRTCDRMLGPFPKTCVKRRDIAVVLTQTWRTRRIPAPPVLHAWHKSFQNGRHTPRRLASTPWGRRAIVKCQPRRLTEQSLWVHRFS